MNKLKVCHFVSGLKSGGVETMIYNYCKEIGNIYYDWYIVYQHEPSKKNIDEFERLEFKFKRVPSKVKYPIRNFIETYKYIKDNKFDVVHCHMTLMNVFPLFAAKLLGVKTRICHSHNSDVRKKNISFLFLEKVLKKLCIDFSTDLVACGNDAGKYMYNNRRFSILNNAMEIDKYKFNKKTRDEIRKKLGIKEDEVVLGHIGRFAKQKNHFFLIDMYKKYISINSNSKLILIGDGELKEEIVRLVEENNLEKNVIFTGIVNNTHEYYSAFDAFLLPSLWEGFPVVSVEAQISGVTCFLSETIDKRCKINDNVYFLELNTELWVHQVGKNKLENKKLNTKKFSSTGLNIMDEKEKLIKLYMSNFQGEE